MCGFAAIAGSSSKTRTPAKLLVYAAAVTRTIARTGARPARPVASVWCSPFLAAPDVLPFPPGLRVLPSGYLMRASSSFACASCGASGGASEMYFSRSAFPSAVFSIFSLAKPR